MGIAEDLLALADRLAKPAPEDPHQASLRRAVSTAYYALFHLLIGEASQRFGSSAASRLGVERSLDHKSMKDVSELFSTKKEWTDWGGATFPIPQDLQEVAKAFVKLQDDRHTADYNNAWVWTQVQALSIVASARTAFQHWDAIRADPVASDYVLSLFIGRKRR